VLLLLLLPEVSVLSLQLWNGGYNTCFTFLKACGGLRDLFACRNAVVQSHLSPSTVALALFSTTKQAPRRPRSPLQYFPFSITLAHSKEIPLENPSCPLNAFLFDLLPLPGITTLQLIMMANWYPSRLYVILNPVSANNAGIQISGLWARIMASYARKFLAFSWAICYSVPPCWNGLWHSFCLLQLLENRAITVPFLCGRSLLFWKGSWHFQNLLNLHPGCQCSFGPELAQPRLLIVQLFCAL